MTTRVLDLLCCCKRPLVKTGDNWPVCSESGRPGTECMLDYPPADYVAPTTTRHTPDTHDDRIDMAKEAPSHDDLARDRNFA